VRYLYGSKRVWVLWGELMTRASKWLERSKIFIWDNGENIKKDKKSETSKVHRVKEELKKRKKQDF
jgi:hypothetical protein